MPLVRTGKRSICKRSIGKPGKAMGASQNPEKAGILRCSFVRREKGLLIVIFCRWKIRKNKGNFIDQISSGGVE